RTMTASYSAGASFERARPARPGPAPTGGPWSWNDREDPLDGMFRVNPQVASGDITSAIGGASYRWTAGNVKAHLDVDVEVPVSLSIGEPFFQSTVDGRIDFPTFGLQRYRFELHGVGTAMNAAPMQRF